MSDTPVALRQVLDLMRADPLSAPALTLYALVTTMNYEKSGCLYKLNKLRDLDAEQRQIAYQLMELMVENGNQGAHWSAAFEEMDRLVRGGRE